MSNSQQRMAKNIKKKTRTTMCFIYNTQFSHNATELKLRIYKNNSSASYNMAVAKENHIM